MMANALALLTALASILLIYGLYFYDLSMTLWGLLVVYLFKTWFLDRMVWLFEDMKHHKEYATWEY